MRDSDITSVAGNSDALLDDAVLASDGMKKAAAFHAVRQLSDGMVVGLGSGTTATFALQAIADRVKSGLHIVGVPTSDKTCLRARELGLTLVTLTEYPNVDLTIDGADEVTRPSMHLIKGGAGNLLREKIVAVASRRFLVVVDESKLAERLGAHRAVPVEVARFGWRSTSDRMRELDCRPALRMNGDGSPFITDGGNYVLDCAFGPIDAPVTLEREIDSIVGVVEHGLFLSLATELIVGGTSGVKTHKPSAVAEA